MKLLLLADTRIKLKDLNKLQRQFTDLYFEHTGITPEFFIEEKDYSDYPTYVDSDGDIRPTHKYLKETCKEVHKRYSGEGTDHVVFLVHEDNWKSDTDTTKGIWGTNYSNVFSGYQVQYCRFDRDNIANSLGTLYHEVHHSHDVFIKTYTGTDVNNLLGLTSWDREVTHGQSKNWDYIRHTENTQSLVYIAPLLVEAYQKRDAIYQAKVRKLNTIVNILTQIVVLLRQMLYKKDGVGKTSLL